MRRAWGIVAALLLVACGPSPPRRPNIVLILADDLGWADLGAHGSPDLATPHIDSLARDGVRFTSGYVSSPQCSPSRAGLLTGRYQNRFGFEYNFFGHWDKGLDPSEETLADLLGRAGYVTGMAGKWHLGKIEPLRPHRRGFSEAVWHPNGGVYLPDRETGKLKDVFRSDAPAELDRYSTDAFTDEAIAFLERHRSAPFFLYLAYPAPHWPMDAKQEHLRRFASVEDRHRRAFLAMMASLDENVGRILETLRRLDLEEDTLVIFLSDNGGATGAARPDPDAPMEPGTNASLNMPFRGEKRDLLEGGIRVPFLMRWTGQLPAGIAYDDPVISLDVVPTALAAAGAAPPARPLDGVDLLPFLRGERTGAPHEALFWRFDFPPQEDGGPRRWAIRQGRWKLLKNASEPLALYDLAEDPGELHDLAASHPERVHAMQTEWTRWNAELRPPAWPWRPAGQTERPPGR